MSLGGKRADHHTAAGSAPGVAGTTRQGKRSRHAQLLFVFIGVSLLYCVGWITFLKFSTGGHSSPPSTFTVIGEPLHHEGEDGERGMRVQQGNAQHGDQRKPLADARPGSGSAGRTGSKQTLDEEIQQLAARAGTTLPPETKSSLADGGSPVGHEAGEKRPVHHGHHHQHHHQHPRQHRGAAQEEKEKDGTGNIDAEDAERLQGFRPQGAAHGHRRHHPHPHNQDETEHSGEGEHPQHRHHHEHHHRAHGHPHPRGHATDGAREEEEGVVRKEDAGGEGGVKNKDGEEKDNEHHQHRHQHHHHHRHHKHEHGAAVVHKHHRHHFKAFPLEGPAKELPSELNGTKVAFGIVVSNEEFIDGALALGWSFMKQSPYVQGGQAEMIAIVPKGSIRTESIERLHAAGWQHVVLVDDLAHEAPRAAWAMTYNKLYLFNLTMYSRVASFDVDMLMLNDPDGVFHTKLPDEHWIGALGNRPKPGRKAYFQTGMMLIVPSEKTFEQMMDEFHSKPIYQTVNGRDGLLVRSIYQANYVPLNDALSAHLDPQDALDGVIGFHFRGDWKPWYNVEKPPNEDAHGMHGGKITQEMGQAYRLWWEHYEALHVQEIAKLDAKLAEEQQHTQQTQTSRDLTVAERDGLFPVGYNPAEQVWLMRYSKEQYTQYLSSVAVQKRNLTHPGLVLERSATGESCTAVCALRQNLCLEEALQYSTVNDCDVLKKVFGCHRCTVDPPSAESPSYDTKDHHCVVNPLYKKKMRPTCKAVDRKRKRLCPCVSLDTAYQPSSSTEEETAKARRAGGGTITTIIGIPYDEGAAPKGEEAPADDSVSAAATKKKKKGRNEEEEEATSLYYPCDPYTMGWFNSSDQMRQCIQYLSDIQNIVSLEPLGHSKHVGRTVKLVATYKAQRPSSPSSPPSPPPPLKAVLKFPQWAFPHEAQSEVVAYAIDRLLRLHRVPPTTYLFLQEDLLKRAFHNVSVPRAFDDGDGTPDGGTPSSPSTSTAGASDEFQWAQKNVWGYLANLPNQGHEEGYSRIKQHKLFIGVSVQLLMYDVHRLGDTDLQVGAVADDNVGRWLTSDQVDDAVDYPLQKKSLHELSLMAAFDYVIGNNDRSVNKNCYVLGGCQLRCAVPAYQQGQRRLSRKERQTSGTILFIDQGKSLYHYNINDDDDVHDARHKAGTGGGGAKTDGVLAGNFVAQAIRAGQESSAGSSSSSESSRSSGGGGVGSKKDASSSDGSGGDRKRNNKAPRAKKTKKESPPALALCRFPQSFYETVSKWASEGPTVFHRAVANELKRISSTNAATAADDGNQDPSLALQTIGEGFDEAFARLGRLSRHLERCRAQLPEDRREPWWS